MYAQLVAQLKKSLGQVETWFDKAVAHAETRSFDPNVLLAARLGPDMFPLLRQVQIACDTSKIAAARLAGQDAPRHEDTEQTIDELRLRLRTVVAYLDGFKASDFEGAATRIQGHPSWGPKVMLGADYFTQISLPNFYFHLGMIYALLRHSGVPLGKADFLGPLSFRAAD